ncbi:MAG TPA: TIGR02253 family HAD-type hydrolase [Planctomycetota bacterium]|nr:TIGR02253 family HAD-type hydrolase [Planctomycetota bacterium]
MTVKGKLRAIFFDIDDTLFSTSAFAESARRNAIDEMISHGLRGEREELLRELKEVIEEFSSNYEHHFDKLLVRLGPEASRGVNREILIAAGVVAYHETKFRELKVYDDVYEVLRDISKTGLRLGVISAGLAVKQAEKLVRLKIYEFLDPRAIFISDQIGINKPNPKLYLRSCEATGVKPAEAMYVGDNPRGDVEPCRTIGMTTVWHQRSGRFEIGPHDPQPDYRIRNFHELRDILVKDFGVELPEPASTPGRAGRRPSRARARA